VVCDEPTSALDGKTGAQIMALLTVVAKDPNRCVVVVTHDNRIYKYADQLIEMEDGRIKKVQQVDHTQLSQF
jgi:putative ABC transport system ATP-binding protein